MSALGKLSPREKDVVERIAILGMTNKEAARDLRLSPRTIETHRENAMRKLEVKNLVELARLVALS